MTGVVAQMFYTPDMRSLILCVALCFGACSESSDSSESEQAGAQTYSTTGEIVQLGDDGRVDIAHDDIEGYMPAMTMPFFASDPSSLEGLSAGDAITFSFTVEESGRHMLASISKR